MTVPEPTAQREWEHYRAKELARLVPVLDRLGFVLEKEQPHTGGERYLMQAVTTAHGRKLILLGTRKANDAHVVIKATSDPAGAGELRHERACREILHRIKFAYGTFFSPREMLFTQQHGFTISVHEFLEQTRPFLERPAEEQFSLALRAFKAQESAHAATYEHRRLVEKTFGSRSAQDYLDTFRAFKKNTLAYWEAHAGLRDTLERGETLLAGNLETIEQYGSFLTHVDFVPHNFRVVDGDIYLLDHSSLRFGNKHEGWARFINFMELYNQPLAHALVRYIKDNRAPEELQSLRLMRVYRLGEILWYYTSTLDKTAGDLRTLNKGRVAFWSAVLEAVLSNTTVPEETVEVYQLTRDLLRSEEEKRRQTGLH